jgi:hypothetical protein
MDSIAGMDVMPPPMMGMEFDVEIEPPIEFMKKQFTTLHLVEPTALQMQRANAELSDGQNMFTLLRYRIRLVAEVSATPREVIERMRISQVEEAFRFLEPFTPLFHLTGLHLSPTSPGSGDGDRMTPGDLQALS